MKEEEARNRWLEKILTQVVCIYVLWGTIIGGVNESLLGQPGEDVSIEFNAVRSGPPRRLIVGPCIFCHL